MMQGASWWLIVARGVEGAGLLLGGSEAMEKTNLCDGVCVSFIGSNEIACNLFAWNNNGNYFYISCFNMTFLSISLQQRQNAKLNIGSISMNFAEGLEMLRLESILDSSHLRGSRAMFKNVFNMFYLFIYYIVVSQYFLPQLLLKKPTKQNQNKQKTLQTIKLDLVLYRKRNVNKVCRQCIILEPQ